MQEKVHRVGVVGYGSSARLFHIPFIQASPSFRLHAVVQRHAKSHQASAVQDFPSIKVYTSLQDLLKDQEIDVVVITTPPGTHFELTAAALKAHKHVVVEKPFTPTFTEANELITLAKDRQLLLTVYQNRRWDADFLTLQTLAKAGTLGHVVEFESHFDRHRPDPPSNTWKAEAALGNGAIYDLGTHLIDQTVHLFGLPEKVTGFLNAQRAVAANSAALEDSFTVLLHYSNGMLATLKSGVISPEKQQLRFWVRGTRGSFRKFGMDPQEAQLKKGLLPLDEGFGLPEPGEGYEGNLTIVRMDGNATSFVQEDVPCVPAVVDGTGTYVEFYRRLAEALTLGEEQKLPVMAEQAAQVIRLVELIQESSRLGKSIIV